MAESANAPGRAPWRATCDTHDPIDLADVLLDIQRGLRFIRDAQGYGRICLELEIRKGQISKWEVAPALSRKPARDGE